MWCYFYASTKKYQNIMVIVIFEYLADLLYLFSSANQRRRFVARCFDYVILTVNMFVNNAILLALLILLVWTMRSIQGSQLKDRGTHTCDTFWLFWKLHLKNGKMEFWCYSQIHMFFKLYTLNSIANAMYI